MFLIGSGSIFGNNESALFIGVVQFIGTSMLPLLVERIGRKALYIVSTIGTTLGLAVLGAYLLLKSLDYDVTSYNWISIVSLSFVVLVQSCAISTLPFVVAAEMLKFTRARCFNMQYGFGHMFIHRTKINVGYKQSNWLAWANVFICRHLHPIRNIHHYLHAGN